MMRVNLRAVCLVRAIADDVFDKFEDGNDGNARNVAIGDGCCRRCCGWWMDGWMIVGKKKKRVGNM